MFKPLHFIIGLGALLLAIVLFALGHALDSLTLLAGLGLLHLFIAPLMPVPANSHAPALQASVSLLLIASVLVAVVAALQPDSNFSLASLIVLAAATLTQLLLQRQPTSASQHLQAASESAAHSTEHAHNENDDEGERESGTVKWFNTTKGFGFISRDNGDDIFVHFRAIRGEGHRVLIEGQRVEYNVVAREKGLQAEDVVEIPSA